MFFNIVSIFPEIITDYMQHGLFSKALQKDLVQLKTWNPREFSKDKNGRIDDKPFGGGRGMLFQAEPIINTVEEIKKQSDTYVVLVSPHGIPFNQEKAKELQSKNNITIVCGRYEGVDERFIDKYVDEEISIGDFIISGGEFAALCTIDAIVRHIPGVLGNDNSSESDSFSNGLLKGPQYSRPEIFDEMEVPDILLSGNHEKIKEWKELKSLEATVNRRPDLLNNVKLTKKQKKLLEHLASQSIL